MNITNITLSSDLLLPRPYAYLYEELCIYFLRWYLPATIIVGTMGTLFSLFFLFCSKLFQSNMLLWLSSICIGDFFILMLEGMWILLKVWFKYDIRDHNDLICKIHKASSNYVLYWSAYMQSALSVQRAYLVFKPLHARGRGGISKKHLVAWIMISLILIAPVAPYLIYWRIIDGDCDPTDRDIFYLTTLCDLIIWGIIPLLGMTVSTVVICLNMAKLGNKFKRAKVASSKRPRKFSLCIPSEVPPAARRRGLSTPTITSVLLKSTTDTHTLSSRIMDHLQQSETAETQMEFSPNDLQRQLTEHNSSRHNAPDNFGHVTRLLICMNIAYMASTFPLLIFLMFRNFSGVDVDPDFHRFCYYLFRSLCFLNSCTNWIFYCLVGKLFREEAKHILRMCCGLHPKVSSRGASNLSGKALPLPLPSVRTPEMSHHTSPAKRFRSISAIDIRRVVTRIPAR
ncbi:unnamed protein product [Taenia asiatica]|uniref:G_PROTEIN_RECEP_F1_2 domain-containing protein n=1 Tax=Taenia asiatica TaxID=60517 RepID=A0A0R3W9Z6_TAEAS|nr:unnamed protein product [Taenia asiatica]